MSTDEEKEKRKKKGKKLVKHKGKKRERIGRGIHSEIFPLYTIAYDTKFCFYLIQEGFQNDEDSTLGC